MAVDLPDVPENIGQEWTNPETGIVYEWNGKRWVAKPNEISLDDVAHLSNTQTFTGSNTFENKTYLKSGDDSHRLYMKDKNNTTNLTIFPTGNISSKGNLSFTAKGLGSFDDLHSARVKVSPPDGWNSSTDGNFGFYVDISNKNTFKNRFSVGGRGGRDTIFEVYDDGKGQMRVYGNARCDNLRINDVPTEDYQATTKEYVDLRDQVNTDHISILAGLRSGGTWKAVRNYTNHSGQGNDPTAKMGLVTTNYDPTEYFSDAIGIIFWETDAQGNTFDFKAVPNGSKFHLSNGSGSYIKFTKAGFFVNIIIFDSNEPIEYTGGGFETDLEEWTVTWGPETTPTEGQLEEAHLNTVRSDHNRASAGAKWIAKNAAGSYKYHDGEAKIDANYAYFAGRDLEGLQIYERDLDNDTFVGTAGKIACNLLLTTRKDDYSILCVQQVTHYEFDSKYLHLYIDSATSPVPYQAFTWKTDEIYYCTLGGWF